MKFKFLVKREESRGGHMEKDKCPERKGEWNFHMALT